jgi:hypothetical protein
MSDLLRLCRNSTDKCNRLILSPTATTLQILTALSSKKEKDLTPKEKEQLALIQRNLASPTLTKSCVDPGACSFFGKVDEVFSMAAADITKSNITKIVKLGGVSANGFVRELQITNQINASGQTGENISSVILKSNLDKTSDNLYYEWVVGNYLNTLMRRFPIFCKTYGIYEYETDNEDMKSINSLPSPRPTSRQSDKEIMQLTPEIAFPVIKRLKPLGADAMLKSLTRPEKICIVVQHVYKPIGFNVLLQRFQILNETLNDESFLEDSDGKRRQLAVLIGIDKSEIESRLNEIKSVLTELRGKSIEERVREIEELKREILFILYQIYFVLALLPTFSHNDLHVGNVILMYAGDNKFYRFHFNGVTIYSKYAAKLIDYGRCVFENPRDEEPTFKGTVFERPKTKTFEETLLEGTTAFKAKLDETLQTLTVWNELPKDKKTDFKLEFIEEENGYPWMSIGTKKCISLDLRLLHFCIDIYKVLQPTFFCSLNRIPTPKNFKTSICNNFTKQQFADDGSLPRHLEFLDEAKATESSCNRVTGSLMNGLPVETPINPAKKLPTYPDIRDVAPALLNIIDPKSYTYSGTCICDIYVSDTENMRVVWPTAMAAGKKTRRRKKTRVKRASLS